ncbi:PD-(D/E)XK nuclease family protein [Priestia megaterium]
MAQRAKLKIPKRFVEKYGEKIPLWSFSKVNSLDNCQWEYYLGRIKRLEGKDNVYSLSGTAAHSVLEDLYNNKIQQHEMKDKFESEFLNIELSDYKFSPDQSKNEKMSEKYKACVMDFFERHEKMAEKVAIEKLVWIDIEGNLFMGYVDAIHKDKEGNFIITDFKTSSLYKGAKVQQNGRQLLLYALGLHQGGVPLEKIKVRWLFLKYVSVTYKQKNGKYRTMNPERTKWVDAIKTPLKKDIKAFYELEEWQADIKLEEHISANSLEGLDQSIIDKYVLSDCYVYPELSLNEINELKVDFLDKIDIINSKGKEESNWERGAIERSEEYFCNVLCSHSHQCKHYKDYIKGLGKKQEEDAEMADLLEDIQELDLPF